MSPRDNLPAAILLSPDTSEVIIRLIFTLLRDPALISLREYLESIVDCVIGKFLQVVSSSRSSGPMVNYKTGSTKVR